MANVTTIRVRIVLAAVLGDAVVEVGVATERGVLADRADFARHLLGGVGHPVVTDAGHIAESLPAAPSDRRR
jgi:hypothetical protein